MEKCHFCDLPSEQHKLSKSIVVEKVIPEYLPRAKNYFKH